MLSVYSVFGTWHRFRRIVVLHTGRATSPWTTGSVLCFLGVWLSLRSVKGTVSPFLPSRMGASGCIRTAEAVKSRMVCSCPIAKWRESPRLSILAIRSLCSEKLQLMSWEEDRSSQVSH